MGLTMFIMTLWYYAYTLCIDVISSIEVDPWGGAWVPARLLHRGSVICFGVTASVDRQTWSLCEADENWVWWLSLLSPRLFSVSLPLYISVYMYLCVPLCPFVSVSVSVCVSFSNCLYLSTSRLHCPPHLLSLPLARSLSLALSLSQCFFGFTIFRLSPSCSNLLSVSLCDCLSKRPNIRSTNEQDIAAVWHWPCSIQSLSTAVNPLTEKVYLCDRNAVIRFIWSTVVCIVPNRQIAGPPLWNSPSPCDLRTIWITQCEE